MDYLHLDSHSQPPSSPAQTRGGPHLSTIQTHQAQLYSQLQKGSDVSTAEWEALLGSIEGGQHNLYDAIYGGPGLSLTETPTSATTNHTTTTWSPDSWDLSQFNLSEFGPGADAGAGSSHSLSEDSLSSSDDLVSVESAMDYRGGMMPVTTADGFVLDGLDGFRL